MSDPTVARPASQSRQLAAVARLLPLVGTVAPFGNVCAPLLILLVAPDDPFVRMHVLDEVNFQLFWTTVGIAAIVLTCGIAVVVLLPLGIVAIVLQIQAAVEANDGKFRPYAYTPRLLA